MINKSPGLHDGRPVGPLARALFRPLSNALSGGHFAPRGRISGRFCRPKGTNLFNPPSPQGTVLRTSPRPQVQAGPPTARCWPCGAGAKPRWPWPCDQSSLQHAHVDMRRPRSRRHQPPVYRPARSSSSSEGDWFTRFQETRFLVTRNKISSYKKQEKLVWCVVEEGPSLHTHKWEDSFSAVPSF